MAFDPDDFLEFASKIHGDPSLRNPAGVRTAVSRCYYSALLTATSLLERHGTALSDNDVHGAVVRILKSKKSNPTCRGLSDDLSTLNGLHIAADLDVQSRVDLDVLVHAHSLASIFNKDIARCLNY